MHKCFVQSLPYDKYHYNNTIFLLSRSVFITGAAGVGKSFILREVIKILPPESTYVTASTGVAACNISGTTFHR